MVEPVWTEIRQHEKRVVNSPDPHRLHRLCIRFAQAADYH